MSTAQRSVLRLVAILMAAGLAVSACSSAGGPTPTAQQGAALGTVTLRLNGDWGHLDPSPPVGVPGGGIPSITLWSPVFDRLIMTGPDPKTPGKITLIPYLASAWTATSTKISFTLRKDATCSDGTPVTASLVKKTYERITAPGRNTLVPFGAGPITLDANDAAGTFSMTLGTPFSEAIYAFANNAIVCEASLTDSKTLITTSVGSGPYTIAEAVHGDHVTFKRRDEWKWGPNGVTAKDIPEKVIYKIVDNDTTAANLLLTGGLDIAQIGGPDVTRLLADKSFLSKTSTSYHNNTILFGQNPSRPTSDIKVREALASGFDRDEYVKAAYQGRAVMSSSYIQPNADCFDPSTADLLPKNPGPDKARAILVAAGYTPGPSGKLQKDGKPLVIQLRGTPVIHGAGGEFLQAQWEKAGMTVNAQITDFNTFVQSLAKHDFDAFLITWPADVPSPNVSIASYLGPTSSGEVKNPEAEAALAAARKAEGPERCRQWSLVQRSMLQHWDLMPTAAPTTHYFSRGIDFVPSGFSYSVLFLRKAK